MCVCVCVCMHACVRACVCVCVCVQKWGKLGICRCACSIKGTIASITLRIPCPIGSDLAKVHLSM